MDSSVSTFGRTWMTKKAQRKNWSIEFAEIIYLLFPQVEDQFHCAIWESIKLAAHTKLILFKKFKNATFKLPRNKNRLLW